MMKKTNKLFFTMCMAGSFALLFGSCKKEEENRVMVNLPQFEEEVDAKAYIDFANSNRFTWNANDELVVYNLATDGTNPEKAIYATGDVEGATTAYFTYKSGDVLTAKKSAGYFAFYPVSKVSDGALGEGNYETFIVSPTQEYTVIQGNPTVDPTAMALACDRQTLVGVVALKPIFGNLRLKLKGTGKVTEIKVEDKKYNLSGTVSMKLHEVKTNQFTALQNAFIAAADPETDPTFLTMWNSYKETLNYSTQGAGKTMTLNCPSVQLNENTETQFIIGLRPGALKYGYKIYVTVEGGTAPYVFEEDNTWATCIKAGVNKGLALEGIN